jgi:tetratricopeptide (TPR) repeat protein
MIAYLYIDEYLNKRAIAEIEELAEEFERLLINIDNDYYADDVNELLSKLKSFSANKKGFAGSKGWSLIAHIYSIREEWPQAEEFWLNSARTGDKTYLAPIAFFQAAVAAEKQNKLDKAIEYLQRSVSHGFEFPDAPRAQFNIGRLYEQLGNPAEALAAYRAVLFNYQWDSATIWQDFARNQIIKLEVR